jgi:hypothetical protein
MAVLGTPELVDVLLKSSSGGEVDQAEIVRAMAKHPDVAKIFLQALSASGQLTLGQPAQAKPQKGRRQRRRK